MGITSSRRQLSGARKSSVLASVLAAALMTSAGSVHALFPVQETGGALFQHIMNQINTYSQKIEDAAEYGEQAMRWRNTLNHYRQQLINLQHMINSFGMPNSLSMEPVPDNYGVAQRCGGGFSMSSIVQGFSLSPNGNIVEQRKKICASVQIASNKKYNETIEFTKRTLPELKKSLEKTNERRDSSSDQGVMEASQYDALNYANTFDTEYNGWRMRMEAYDSYIAAMENQQKQLTELGLKGEQNALGTLVKTVSLKAALEVGD